MPRPSLHTGGVELPGDLEAGASAYFTAIGAKSDAGTELAIHSCPDGDGNCTGDFFIIVADAAAKADRRARRQVWRFHRHNDCPL